MNVPHVFPARGRLRRIATVLALGAALVTLGPQMAPRHVAHAADPVPPAATVSRYMKTTDTTTLFNEGCDAGNRATGSGTGTASSPYAIPDGVVVLDFGQPTYTSTAAISGTFLFNNAFASTTDISLAAKSFTDGFWDCTPPNGPFLTLVVGTNNYIDTPNTRFESSRSRTNGLDDIPSEWAGHGTAWGNMMNNIEAYVQNQPYTAQIQVEGGSDMEVNAFNNNPTNTRAWASAYGNTPNNGWSYQNYGDASGCPTSGTTTATPGNCDNAWTQDDVYDVSWNEIAAFPLPEIYSAGSSSEPYGGDADEWQQVSRYAYNKDTVSMYISGAATQYQACADSVTPTQPNPCPGTDNTPSVGWTQLYKALNSDSNTAQDLAWSTDFTKQN